MSELIVPAFVGKWIELCTASNGRLHSRQMKLHMTPEVDDWIRQSGLTTKQIKWLYDHKAVEIPKCRNCGKPLQSYDNHYCSRACCCRDEQKAESRRQKISVARKLFSDEKKQSIADKRKETIANWSEEQKMAHRRKAANSARDAWTSKSDEEKEAIKQKIRKTMDSKSDEEKEAIKQKIRKTMDSKSDEEKENLRRRLSDASKLIWMRKTEEDRINFSNKLKAAWENHTVEQNAEISAKRKTTCIEKYGVENPFQSDDVKQKIAQTNIERYGYAFSMQNEDVKKKAIETNRTRYGCDYASQSKGFRERYTNTCREKWGVDAYTQSEEHKAKIVSACREKWGVDNYSFTDEFKIGLAHWTRWSNWESNKRILAFKDIALLDTRKVYADNTIHHYRCERCGKDFWSTDTNPQVVRCIDLCRWRKGKSNGEIEVQDFIKSLGFQSISKDRSILSGKELDIFVPEKKLAIEYNGSWWHRGDKIGKDYHLNKTLGCQKKSIRLIHVFEWEWQNRRPACESLIKSALGIFDHSIGARECAVMSLESGEYRKFLEENHLQGAVNSSIRIGLKKDGELVACAGWGGSRFKQGEMELHRFCLKSGWRIQGALSKLCAHSGLDSFVSYVDLAHFTGDGYRRAGFVETGRSAPNYRWCRGTEVLTRMQTQKHKLPELLGESFDPSLTEAENMALAGWTQVFDCGNIKMEWNRQWQA